jgi:hypothetical protein
MLKPAAADKLGKLLRMLSSDKDGEALAATAAIKRTLAAEGSDIHSLADALCKPAPPPPRPEPQRPPPKDDPDWHGIACECEAHSERLTEREQEFVSDMVAWKLRKAPTEKQQSWLLSIYGRVRRYG